MPDLFETFYPSSLTVAEDAKAALDGAGIDTPFPHQVVAVQGDVT